MTFDMNRVFSIENIVVTRKQFDSMIYKPATVLFYVLDEYLFNGVPTQSYSLYKGNKPVVWNELVPLLNGKKSLNGDFRVSAFTASDMIPDTPLEEDFPTYQSLVNSQTEWRANPSIIDTETKWWVSFHWYKGDDTIDSSDTWTAPIQISGKGEKGEPGEKGDTGERGKGIFLYEGKIDQIQTYVPVDDPLLIMNGKTLEAGDMIYTSSSPQSVFMVNSIRNNLAGISYVFSLKGEQGDKGDKGDKGEPGNDGSPGRDGTSNFVKAETREMTTPQTSEGGYIIGYINPDTDIMNIYSNISLENGRSVNFDPRILFQYCTRIDKVYRVVFENMGTNIAYDFRFEKMVNTKIYGAKFLTLSSGQSACFTYFNTGVQWVLVVHQQVNS